jgi:hypothetical protein
MIGLEVRITTDYMTERCGQVGKVVQHIAPLKGGNPRGVLVEFASGCARTPGCMGGECQQWFAPYEFELVRPAKDVTLSAWVARADGTA